VSKELNDFNYDLEVGDHYYTVSVTRFASGTICVQTRLPDGDLYKMKYLMTSEGQAIESFNADIRGKNHE
jgi:hypothetical protein